MSPERLAEIKRLAFASLRHCTATPDAQRDEHFEPIAPTEEYLDFRQQRHSLALELIAEIERLQEENRALHEECLEYRYGADL